MTDKNRDKPAMPNHYSRFTNAHGCEDEFYAEEKGLTKREAFAMAAMQGILSHSFGRGTHEELAVQSIECADALLKELDKE